LNDNREEILLKPFSLFADFFVIFAL